MPKPPVGVAARTEMTVVRWTRGEKSAINARVKELKVDRSEYIRRLVHQDLKEAK